MELMGAKHITDVKMKIITMLRYVGGYNNGILCPGLIHLFVCIRHCLTFKDSELICVTLRAWNSFIHWLVVF